MPQSRDSKPDVSKNKVAPMKAPAPATAEPAATTTEVVRKAAGGRPPKYAGPSRPVTLTLPESTLEGLAQVHPDRGRAIVKLTEAALRTGTQESAQVEIVQMVDRTGLLVVGPSEALRRIPFLHLVEVAPARHLLAMDPGNDFRSLELALQDVLEDVPVTEERERGLIGQLLDQVRTLRKTARVRMAEILFVELPEKGRTAVHSLMHTLSWFLTAAA
jgi:hypothetical protein